MEETIWEIVKRCKLTNGTWPVEMEKRKEKKNWKGKKEVSMQLTWTDQQNDDLIVEKRDSRSSLLR